MKATSCAAAAAVNYVTATIPGAVGPTSIPSRDMELWASQPPMLADEVERFVTGSTCEHFAPAERAFAVVLYTDLVGSTKQAAEMGDRRWRSSSKCTTAPAAGRSSDTVAEW